MRARLLTSLVAVLLVPVAVWAAPSAGSDTSPVDEAAAACRSGAGSVPEAGPRACRSVEQGGRAGGHVCRHTPGAPTTACETVDGRHLSAAAIEAYEGSWVHRALTLQRALDDGAPFVASLVPHTHNSYNSVAYPPTVSGLDHNQVYGLADQLHMDMRGLELDVHWAPNAEGDPAQAMRAPVLCHAEEIDPGDAPGAHAGCTTERHLRHGLAEIREFLLEPGREDEVVIVYLENHLEKDRAAHDAAAAAIAAELDDLVHRPPAGRPCAEMPMDASRADLRAAGGRVLLVGDCGPGAWGTWVHERGPRWREDGNGRGDDYAPNGCAAERAARGYDTNFIRHWEDSTWLSAMADAGGELTVAETRRMVECGVNFVGFDQLQPDDPRLAALVWSWAPGEPAGAGTCAAQGADGRFRSEPCGEQRAFACVDDVTGAWRVSAVAGPWAGGEAACAAAGARFAVPQNGWENTRLVAAKPPGVGEAWLALHRQGPVAWEPGP